MAVKPNFLGSFNFFKPELMKYALMSNIISQANKTANGAMRNCCENLENSPLSSSCGLSPCS